MKMNGDLKTNLGKTEAKVSELEKSLANMRVQLKDLQERRKIEELITVRFEI